MHKHTKNVISTCALAVIGIFSINANAATIINSCEDLAAIPDNSHEDYIIGQSFDCADVDITPILNFQGTLNGQGLTISNLTIDQQRELPLTDGLKITSTGLFANAGRPLGDVFEPAPEGAPPKDVNITNIVFDSLQLRAHIDDTQLYPSVGLMGWITGGDARDPDSVKVNISDITLNNPKITATCAEGVLCVAPDIGALVGRTGIGGDITLKQNRILNSEFDINGFGLTGSVGNIVGSSVGTAGSTQITVSDNLIATSNITVDLPFNELDEIGVAPHDIGVGGAIGRYNSDMTFTSNLANDINITVHADATGQILEDNFVAVSPLVGAADLYMDRFDLTDAVISNNQVLTSNVKVTFENADQLDAAEKLNSFAFFDPFLGYLSPEAIAHGHVIDINENQSRNIKYDLSY